MDILIILSVGVLLAIYNGYFINKQTQMWKSTGWVIRALLMFVLWPDITLMVIYLWLVWPLYDIIIRLMMGVSIFHEGTTGWFAKYIPPIYKHIGKMILTFFVVYLVLHNWV